MNNELLLGISALLEPIRKEVSRIAEELSVVQKDVAELKADVAELKADVKDLKIRMGKVETELADVQRQVHKQGIQIENDIIPRLSTIEKCYVDTYYRYQKSVEGYEQMQMDIRVIRDVVLEHSKKIQQLA